MGTQCSKQQVALQPHGRRRVEVGFDGGSITTGAGVVLLREFEERLGIKKLEQCQGRIGGRNKDPPNNFEDRRQVQGQRKAEEFVCRCPSVQPQ